VTGTCAAAGRGNRKGKSETGNYRIRHTLARDPAQQRAATRGEMP
jgi:hypothetical protein